MESERVGATYANPVRDVELDELTWVECLELASSAMIGRLAFTRGGAPPLVVPVNFVLDGDVIVFRTDETGALAQARDSRASFQVDWIDPGHHTGWSVLFRGVVRDLSRDRIASLELDPWVGPRVRWVSLVPEVITGRRLRLVQPDLDQRGYA